MAQTLEQIIYNYAQARVDPLPQKYIDQYLQALSPEDFQIAMRKDADDIAFRASIWQYYQRSLREAARLSYTEHPEVVTWTMQRPLAVIEYHEPEGNMANLGGFLRDMAQLAVKYRLVEKPEYYHSPDAMWHVLHWRRDGDAVIAMIGDDRDYSHLIVVVWSPQRLMRRPDSIPPALL